MASHRHIATRRCVCASFCCCTCFIFVFFGGLAPSLKQAKVILGPFVAGLFFCFVSSFLLFSNRHTHTHICCCFLSIQFVRQQKCPTVVLHELFLSLHFLPFNVSCTRWRLEFGRAGRRRSGTTINLATWHTSRGSSSSLLAPNAKGECVSPSG